MPSAKNVLNLPYNAQTWEEKVSGHDDDVSNIHSLEVIESASKIPEGQFLSLRVLWKSFEAGLFDFQKFGIASEYDSACQFLDSLDCWVNYVKDIRDRASNTSTVFPDLGTFTLVRDHQLEAARVEVADDTSAVEFSPVASRTRRKAEIGIEDSPLYGKGKGAEDLDSAFQDLDLSSPLGTPSTTFAQSPVSKEAAAILFPATRDEQIVNTALLLFLRAVSIHKLRNPSWTLQRQIFKVHFPKGKLEARTDGFLELNGGGEREVKAIVEVKACVREGNEQVRMQESAQMVAWIASEPDTFTKPQETKQ